MKPKKTSIINTIVKTYRPFLSYLPMSDVAISDDRISALPDEILHDILGRLRSPKQTVQLTLLSKRWTHLMTSYPILEFKGNRWGRRETLESEHNYALAVLEKFRRREQDGGYGDNISVEAVRVEIDIWSDFYSDILDRVLQLAAAAASSLREIDVKFIYGWEPYSIPESLFLVPSLQSNSERFPRLNVLKLKDCDFGKYKDLVTKNNNPFSALGSSLRELCFENVRFPQQCGGRILNSMIAGAPLLEKLTLKHIKGIVRFRIRNHGSIKSVQVNELRMEDFEIAGARCLEKVRIVSSRISNLQISLTPNVLVVDILDASGIDNVTAKLPSLELLTLCDLAKVDELEIVSCGKIRQVRSKKTQWKNKRWSSVAIDVPRLCRIYCNGEHLERRKNN